MKIAEVKKMPPMDRFLYWIKERRQILIRKISGYTKPWTDDEILQKYYFTNVRREDDKVTIWVTENIIKPWRDDPKVVFAVIAFRWFNLPEPTGEYLLTHGYLEDWNTARVVQGLLGFQKHGMKIFTGAFNISNSGSTKPKVNRVCEDYIEPVWKERDLIYRLFPKSIQTLENAFNIIKKYPGLGGSGFMAAQIICDLAFTHVLEKAVDWDTWCSWGPGSKRGMNRVFDLPAEYAMPRAEWDKHLVELRSLIREKLDLYLHARDVQNCLCEYFKYDRVLNGGGSKRKYPGAK